MAFAMLKVLIADDDVIDRQALRRSLEKTGIEAEVMEAQDGTEALQILERFPAELVLCDISMAPMNGIDFVREIRNGTQTRDPNLPIILVSGYLEAYLEDLGDLVGSDEMLTKPVTPSVLRTRIRSILRKAATPD